VRPLASRNVVMPLESVVAVPVVRPDPSRNVFVPLLSVVTVPVMRPLASRKVVEVCADAAVIMASVSAAMVKCFHCLILLAAVTGTRSCVLVALVTWRDLAPKICSSLPAGLRADHASRQYGKWRNDLSRSRTQAGASSLARVTHHGAARARTSR